MVFCTGKKTDVPGSDGYVPSIFPHNKPCQPRSSRTSTAAGYMALPKTWYHIRHRLRVSRRPYVLPSSSVGRPTKPQVLVCVPPFLASSGHDYVRTALDISCSSLPAEVTQELASLEQALHDTSAVRVQAQVLTLENVKNNDRLFQFYTNLPNFSVFDALREYLQTRLGDGPQTIRRWRGSKYFHSQQSKTSGVFSREGGYSSTLSFEEEFFLVLVKLKTGRMNQDLAFNFGISVGLLSELFTTFLYFLSSELKALFEMVDCGAVTDGIPSVYQNVSQLRVVLDCTELMLQKPSDLQERKETFSNYKHNETVKFLVGMSPQLYLNYISKAWGGRASDKHITLHSESLLHGLPSGSQVMVDRGFTVSHELKKLGVRTIIPAFKGRGRPQLTAFECSRSEDIAKARIHIERIIQRIRTFHILGSVVRLNMCDVIEQLFTVCAYLTNFQTPIIRCNEIKTTHL